MSNKPIDFIFCPLCGGTKWITDPTGYADGGKLTYKKCTNCKKFTYINHTAIVEHAFLVGVTHTSKYEIDATIDPYRIKVNYHKGFTQFLDAYSNKLVLEVQTAVNFNWYKNEALVKKIKTYVLFS